MEVYGTLIPYVESVGTYGATPINTPSEAYQVQTAQFSGIDHAQRFRMTSGTSQIGFRGRWPIAPSAFELIWQVESPAPIDGEGPSSWASRNSHVGFTGGWGTFIFGNWDTPMRWVTVTSINPIKAGYTGDMTPIIGSPGHSTPAWNASQDFTALFELPPSRAGFFRHEANAIQYWSPTLAGFSLRLMFAANEHRIAGQPSTTPGEPAPQPALNPYLLSGYLGYDNDWLRLRYSAEFHNDYFGTGIGNGAGVGPGQLYPSSQDLGHLALASVKINAGSDYETRIVATGDLLSYHTDALPAGAGQVNEFSRAAFYGLAQQKFGSNSVWVAYGHATEGSCSIAGAAFAGQCTTTGLGADYYTLGYMHEFSENAGIYSLAYALVNDTSARYTPFPLLEARIRTNASFPNEGVVSHGSDVIGVGVGFVYHFAAKILGGGDEAAPVAKEASAPEVDTPPDDSEDATRAVNEPPDEEDPAEPRDEEPPADTDVGSGQDDEPVDLEEDSAGE